MLNLLLLFHCHYDCCESRLSIRRKSTLIAIANGISVVCRSRTYHGIGLQRTYHGIGLQRMLHAYFNYKSTCRSFHLPRSPGELPKHFQAEVF